MKKSAISKQFPLQAHLTIPRMPRWMVQSLQKLTMNGQSCLYNHPDVTLTRRYYRFSEWSTERAEGFPELEIDVIEPNQTGMETGPRKVLFYVHGGGFMWDASVAHYRNLARYAARTGVVIVMPRYRLAPRYHNPCQLSDCKTAWQWLMDHGKELNLDVDNAGIGGDSAGGFLAVNLTLWAVESGWHPAYQLLLYPVIDPFMRSASMERGKHTPVWNAKLSEVMWRWLFADSACMHAAARKESCMLDRIDLSGMPVTYLETAEFDCLHDEGIAYAEKLALAGVTVQVNQTRGTMHGFDQFRCAITDEAIENRIAFIREQSGSTAENLVLYGKTRFN